MNSQDDKVNEPKNDNLDSRKWNSKNISCIPRGTYRVTNRNSDNLDSWIVGLEDKEQPVACSIDDEDCEACGS